MYKVISSYWRTDQNIFNEELGKCKALCFFDPFNDSKGVSLCPHFYEGALKLKTIELSMLMPKLQSRVSRIEAKVKTEPCAELKLNCTLMRRL